jgi:uncharacterized phage infection (PIP) family protein YhgE
MRNKLLDKITKSMLLRERYTPDFKSSLQALEEIVSTLNPRSDRDRGKVQLAKEQIFNLKKQFRSLDEELGTLRERVSVLEEDKGDNQNKALDKARK